MPNGDPSVSDPVLDRPPTQLTPIPAGRRLFGVTDVSQVQDIAPPTTPPQAGFGAAPVRAPSTDDLLANAINRKRMIESGIDPDAPARYISSIRPRGGPSRMEELRAEAQATTRLQMQGAINDARMKHEEFVQNQHIKAATQLTDMLGLVQNIPYQHGTPEFANEIIGIAAAHPLGAQTSAWRDIAKPLAASHDVAASIRAELESLPAGTRLKSAQIPTGTGGHIIVEPEKSPKEKTIPPGAVREFARLTGSIAQHQKQAEAEAATKIKAGAKGTENIPYSKSAEWAGDEAELSKLVEQYPGLAPASVTPPPVQEVIRTTQDGRKAVFDSATKKFLRYAE